MFAFHVLLFQVLATLAWSNWNWFLASLTLLTHAGLSLLDQWAAFWTQRSQGAAPGSRPQVQPQGPGLRLLVRLQGLGFRCSLRVQISGSRCGCRVQASGLGAASRSRPQG